MIYQVFRLCESESLRYINYFSNIYRIFRSILYEEEERVSETFVHNILQRMNVFKITKVNKPPYGTQVRKLNNMTLIGI